MMLVFQLVLGEGTPVLILIALAIGVVGYVATRVMRGRAVKAFAADNPGASTEVGQASA